MSNLVRFSDYDVFGYLIPGLVLIACWDLVQGTHFVWEHENWTISAAAFVVILGYVLGHIAAALATLCFDRLLVRGVIGAPPVLLFKRSRQPSWHAWILGEYLVPLHPHVRERVIAAAGLDPAKATTDIGETLFWRAWPVIKRDPIPCARMESFLRLYGFCRNFSFVSLVAAVAIATAPLFPHGANDVDPRWAILALFISAAMFYRYLKFLRLYSVEIFSTFAEAPTAAASGQMAMTE